MSQSLLEQWNLDLASISLLAVTICAFLIPVILILPPVGGVRQSDALLQTHTKAAVKSSKSGLRNQHASQHTPQAGQPPKVQSLVVYPVKSCRGVEVTRSRIFPQGFEHDRLFMFGQLKSPFPVSLDASETEKNEHKWEFVTQRQFPRLATVKVDLWLPDEMKLRKQSMRTNEAFIIMSFPCKEDGWRGLISSIGAKLSRGLSAEPEKEILLPVNFPSEAEIKRNGYTFEVIRIWKETVTALNMEAELPEELRRYLGVSNKLALFRVDPARLREVYRCAPRKDEAGYQPVTGFQDAYPLHLMTLNSLQAFSSELAKEDKLQELDVLRFRPNIILSGAQPYDEETWKQVRFKPGSSGLYNDVRFHVSCRTVRCKMPNVDQVTGARHGSQPDKSLRAQRAVDPGAPLLGCLGMQLTPLFEEGLREEDRDGWVSVGMTVDVEERGEHVYIKQ
ncbi:hypothetical protein F4780DRAFT_732639 [Xylariomycetidae sp. FL0641]|nr:hypothetical protein F4780DRAFT_732639 [Xylariomycetidae sp. FL0641]